MRPRSHEIKVSRLASTAIKRTKRRRTGAAGDVGGGNGAWVAGGGEITARRSDTRRMRGIFSLRGHAHPSFYAAFLRSFDFSTLHGATVPFLRFPQRGPTKVGKFLLIPKLRILYSCKRKFRSRGRTEMKVWRRVLENHSRIIEIYLRNVKNCMLDRVSMSDTRGSSIFQDTRTSRLSSVSPNHNSDCRKIGES